MKGYWHKIKGSTVPYWRRGLVVDWLILVGFSRLYRAYDPPQTFSSDGMKSVRLRIINRIVETASRFFSPDISQIIVLERYQAIYFAVPKVANSSLKTFFADLLGLEGESRHRSGKAYLFNEASTRQRLYSEGIMITRTVAARKTNYWKFAFVRNPWGRLVSFYSSAMKSPHIMKTLTDAFYGMFWPEMSFGDFAVSVCKIPDIVSNRHFVSQYRFLIDSRGNIIPDYIGRYETLHENFLYVCKKLGIGAANLPNVNPGKYRVSYRDFYTLALRKAVAERYEQDIATFHFTF